MGLETGTYIDDLVITNPAATDKRREGDDHLRLIKKTMKNSFPNVDGAVNPSVAEFNYLVGVTDLIQDQLDARLVAADAPGDGLVEAAGVLAVGVGLGIAVNADDVQIELSGLDALEGNAIAPTDGYLVDDEGVPKRVEHTDAGIPVVTVSDTEETLATADMNTYREYTAVTAITITLDIGVGKKGNFVIIEQAAAGQVTIDGTSTVNSAYGLKTVKQYSVIVLVCKGSDIWTLYGDTSA